MTTAVIITTWNRPALVFDAVRSVIEQDTDDWTLYVMDDGCNDEARRSIARAIGDARCAVATNSRLVPPTGDPDVVWYQGPDRTPTERRSLISYAMLINIALTHLLGYEQYVSYLPDDDYLYPEATRARATFLDQHPEAHVCYGRTRSVQYGADGAFNRWTSAGPPQPGMAFPRPTGTRVLGAGGGNALTYFGEVSEYTSDLNVQRHAPVGFPERDPQTGLPYVEEGFWTPGVCRYGEPHRQDHSQVMHRRSCLTTCRTWPRSAYGDWTEYWPEHPSYGVADAGFFERLAAAHEFHAVDAWILTKRFHGKSIGCSGGPVRE